MQIASDILDSQLNKTKQIRDVLAEIKEDQNGPSGYDYLQRKILYQGFWKYKDEHYGTAVEVEDFIPISLDEKTYQSRPQRFARDFEKVLAEVRKDF